MDKDAINPQQPLPDLVASFKMKRGLLRRERIVVNVYALSDNGCVIKTDEAFSSGDEIRLTLSLEMPFENAATPLLFGRIREGRKYCSNFFYQIDFTEQNKRSAYRDIGRIRDLLERKVALTHRRRGGGRTRELAESALGISGIG